MRSRRSWTTLREATAVNHPAGLNKITRKWNGLSAWDGVGPSDAISYQRDPLKNHPIFGLSRNFHPVIFDFKECRAKILPLRQARSGFHPAP
jgi:hypothetical protein